MAVFANYDQAGLDAQYNLRNRHPDHESFFTLWAEESARVRGACEHRASVPYGDTPLQNLDAFSAKAPGAPLHIFIHGGYWQGLDKSSFSYPAQTFVEAGAAFVSINYDLAPTVTIPEIVRQCRRAVAWCHANAASLNADPERIYISGHSAGGHLTGAMMVTDWAAEGLPANVLKGGTPISGLFDLEPIRLCYMNAVLALDEAAVAGNSPLRTTPPVGMPLIAAVGGGETDEFLRHNAEFTAHWAGLGHPAQEMVVPGKNHFDVVLELKDANAPLTRAMLAQMGL